MGRNTTIVAVCGLPGSGKSYFASHLAHRTGALYLSSDEVRKQLYAVRTYSDEEKSNVYRELTARALQAARKGTDVVLDATFYRKDLRDHVTKTLELPVRWIEVRADESIIRDRVTNPRTHSEADFNVYLKIRDAWEPLTDEHLVLESTNENIDDMIDQAVQYLRHDK